ncbi:hypothetical protein Q7C36_006276 [Tachysurus vachellii]|uniref:Uncharacterized protein n=1 Tax=Tachysurus vachellii TaxID=175792 RepID=A0AA88N940_TACVA|nr:hypothetical protein Q7C36_006276 [Tachysurus vachellii]
MAEPIQKVEELLISLTGQPDEAPLPTAIATLEEEVQNTTEFPALNRNWHSPQPSPITPPPVQPSTEPLPPRTVKKLRGSASKQTLEKHNPAVANVDEVPDFFAINTCPITCNTVETPRAAFVQKPQGDILSQIVMVHPETPNPQLDQGTEESPQIRAVDESAVDALLCISEDDMEQNILPMPQLTPIATPTPSPRALGESGGEKDAEMENGTPTVMTGRSDHYPGNTPNGIIHPIRSPTFTATKGTLTNFYFLRLECRKGTKCMDSKYRKFKEKPL